MIQSASREQTDQEWPLTHMEVWILIFKSQDLTNNSLGYFWQNIYMEHAMFLNRYMYPFIDCCMLFANVHFLRYFFF